MIKEVHIENFQSHEKTKLELVSGVNVIVGESGAGKSAIIRALEWLFENRPLGDDFRKHGSKKTSVSVTFDDEIKITRAKSNSVSTYMLNDIKFSSFGQEPPEEIRKATNINRSLNFQAQIDPFFLLQSSAGEIARFFNNISGLEEIDVLNKGLNQSTKKAQQAITSTENNIVDLEQQLEQHKDLNKIGKLLAKAEGIEKEIADKQRTKKYLQNILYKISKHNENIQQYKDKLEIKPYVEQASELIEKKQEIKNKKHKIQSYLQSIESKKTQIKKSKLKLQKDKERFEQEMPDVCPLCENVRDKI